MLESLIGRLSDTHTVFPYLYEPINQQLIILFLFILISIGVTIVIATISYLKKWRVLWNDWITSVDHKKIGIMYILVSIIMLFRGFVDAMMIRTQQALSSGEHVGYLIPEHFDQLFTAHGVIMIFFVAMPLMLGLMNFVIPLQIGARDVAFPYLNSLSFWLFVAGVLLINISLLIGDFAHGGWLSYPPFSEIEYSPGVGIDYWIWGLQISGVGSLISGINFFVTIIKMRCEGMSLMKMPIFTWTSLCSVILIIAAFPVLTITLLLLTLDRYLDMHFFTILGGGDPMMYINLIWIWGHPEVYILILPAFGIFSEIASVFSKKALFGYKTMVWATLAITLLSFLVWLHHFFTMGAGSNVNSFFGIMTMIISIPTGVKIFNWLFTMYRGKIVFYTPMFWLLGFIITFSIGGMTGVLLSVPGIDFQMHNSTFLIAHFHNVIIGGVLFGYFAGLIYWFPKIFGCKLNEKLGKYSFWFWIIGFFVAFMPLYYLGILGMTRRLYHYDSLTGFQPWLILAWIGAILICIGIVLQILQVIYSIKNKDQDITGDPWDGRTLEWSTVSPPPLYNFALSPKVNSKDAFLNTKKSCVKQKIKKDYKAIHMPLNTGAGFMIGILSFIFGFAMIWHIWWLAICSLIGIFFTIIKRSLNYNIDYYISIKEIQTIENKE